MFKLVSFSVYDEIPKVLKEFIFHYPNISIKHHTNKYQRYILKSITIIVTIFYVSLYFIN